MKWVRKTSLSQRKTYKKTGIFVYGSGIVTSSTGVRIHSAPGMKFTTEEVRPHGELLYCYGTNNKDGFEWWRVDPNGLKWVRKTSLSQRKSFKELIEIE